MNIFIDYVVFFILGAIVSGSFVKHIFSSNTQGIILRLNESLSNCSNVFKKNEQRIILSAK